MCVFYLDVMRIKVIFFMVCVILCGIVLFGFVLVGCIFDGENMIVKCEGVVCYCGIEISDVIVEMR